MITDPNKSNSLNKCLIYDTMYEIEKSMCKACFRLATSVVYSENVSLVWFPSRESYRMYFQHSRVWIRKFRFSGTAPW